MVRLGFSPVVVVPVGVIISVRPLANAVTSFLLKLMLKLLFQVRLLLFTGIPPTKIQHLCYTWCLRFLTGCLVNQRMAV